MEWIRERRKALGLTQWQLADKLSVTGPSVSTWETGRRRPPDDMIRRLCELLGAPIPEDVVPAPRRPEPRREERRAAPPRPEIRYVPRLGAFARALSGGTGKVVGFDERSVTLEYFVHPGDASRETRTLPLEDVTPCRLSPQTRCYFRMEEEEPWRVGRTQRMVDGEYEVYLPNGQALFVSETLLYARCERPIEDPIDVLKMKAHETPFFHTRRQPFVQSLTRQRAVSRGMSGLLSASIELLPHQVEVVRRVLEDPIQRYLLADEVGLGKTIEAGVILRQYLLDEPRGSVRVFVPPMLVAQWETELATKFDAFELAEDVEVVGTERLGDLANAPIPGMVILDEAHHLAALAYSELPEERARFESFRRLAHGADRLLLLSATPALHNERSFLAMLHLLEPRLYRLEDEVDFRSRVARRQQVGQLLLSLREGVHPFVIRKNLQALRTSFAGDEKLDMLVDALGKTLEQSERETRDEAIRALRVHMSETYRLHRRMLRNRRLVADERLRSLRYVEGGTTPRPLVQESDGDERTAEVWELLESWRHLAHAHLVRRGSPSEDELTRLYCLLWSCAGSLLEVLHEALQSRLGGVPRPGTRRDLSMGDVRLLCELPRFEGEEEILAALADKTREASENGDRCTDLLACLQTLRKQGGARGPKVLVFTAYTQSSEVLGQRLRARLGMNAVALHQVGMASEAVEKEVTRFREPTSGCDVLICDASGEEGLNLQGADVVIHFDLPLSPNRIEQRIGRVDRIGREAPMRTRVFVGPDLETSSHQAWFSLLHDGLGVFRQSIASLQFFVDERMPIIRAALFRDGEQGLRELLPTLGDAIRQEHVRLGEQDALDAIEALAPDVSGTFFQELRALDEDAETLERAMNGWAREALMFSYQPAEEHPPLHLYKATRDTLVPSEYLMDRMMTVLEQPGSHQRDVAVRHPGAVIFRLGDSLVSALDHYMRWDDRGRCFAMWRQVPDWDATPGAERYFFHFDYLVEADLEAALEEGKRLERFVPGALRRWADALYAPFTESIFMDGRTEVRQPEWLEALRRPYLSHDQGGRDWNLAKERLRDIDRVVDPGHWAALCQRMRESSEVHLKMRDAFIAHKERVERSARTRLAARLEQSRSRLYREEREAPERAQALREELRAEEALSEALLEGIRAPRVRLDSVGFIVLSGCPLGGP